MRAVELSKLAIFVQRFNVFVHVTGKDTSEYPERHFVNSPTSEFVTLTTD